MDNPIDNLNPSPSAPPMPEAPKQEPEMKFSSYKSMQKNSKSRHFLYAVIVLVVAGVALLLYFYRTEFDFVPTQLKVRPETRQSGNEVNEVDSINVGDLDSEFQSIDTDLNSL